RICVVKAVNAAAEKEAVAVVDLVVEAGKAQPAAIVTFKGTRCYRRDHRRGAILPAVFARNEKVSTAAGTDRTAERGRSLFQRIVSNRIPIGSVCCRKAGEFGLRLRRPE